MSSLTTVLACVQLTIVGTPTPPAVVRHAAQQAADIWRPHGVIVALDGEMSACPPDTAIESLIVVMSEISDTSATLRLPRLGEIVFGSDGEPDPEIVIASEYLQQAVDKASWSGQSLANRPEALRRRAAGRAIGRVLAHELGHYLLRMPEHTRRGLMRPVYSIPALLEPNTRKYRLDDADASRLRTLFLDRRMDVTRW